MKWFVFLITLMIPNLVLAGTISLTTSITTDVITTDQEQVHVSITNFGDEAAYNVQLSLITDYFFSDPIHVGTLEINKPFEGRIPIIAEDTLKEGNYPVVLLTEYTDVNSYPFSSVSPATLTYKNPSSSKIVSEKIEDLGLSGKRAKNLVLKLKNMDQVDHVINIKLILPNELYSDVNERNIEIKSKEEKDVVFKVSNFAGLEGSNYVILALIEYEDDYHYSSIIRGMVRIIGGKNIFELPEWAPIAGLIITISILILYLLKSNISFKFVREKHEKRKK